MSRSYAQINTDLGGAFGAEPHFADQLTQLDTTSETFATFFSLSEIALPAGTYRAGIVFQYGASTGSTQGEYRATWNGAILDVETLQIASAGERKTYANFGYAVLAAAVYTLNVDIRRSAGAGTFSIDDGHLELWRVA